ncbi:NADAR family protein [Klebsiella phage vB_KpnM_KB57]|uniref:NADAR domain-containing protein n=1 Tax=Klebsiella phage vB_KpnM_KB57 TaxID=1719140 RepID=A0A0S1S3H3_9CAUD|nr:NADAR family protein [Klebsiella phage vB_KpnM_KB57]ALM02506.1 hypothetical protein KB57_119 [Klebsiella phage vB_KpnM_KB57]
MRVTDKYVFFFTYRDMFSNHYRQVIPIRCGGYEFFTVEHYMMFQKAMLFDDKEIASRIATVDNPNEAKALGRQVKGFDNSVWEENRMDIVTSGLVLKMKANRSVLEAALGHRDAGRKFVEASPYDAIWGVKLNEYDTRIDDPTNWRGLNLLGKCWERAIDIVVAATWR